MPSKLKKRSILKRLGLSGYNKPKRTPDHPTKSHVVAAKEGSKEKIKRRVCTNESKKKVF